MCMLQNPSKSQHMSRNDQLDRRRNWSGDPWLQVRPCLDESLLLSAGLCPTPPAIRPSYHPYDSQPVTLPDVRWNPLSFMAVAEDENYEGPSSRRTSLTGGTRIPEQRRLCRPIGSLAGTSRKPSGRVVSPPQDVHTSWMGQGKDRRDPRCCISGG
ncbi:hypothetical protein OE88DRAFT_1028882 [Heliocybe sulcata]|uniref:Uncharacterized protein n=1 Tax=Heliocybe sulcata TaxID=5364 RepID=A0A5C3ND85_9AGAM|nr:hypothetical protein OE88DRAFT_1028882 [Heliocybe sulcata]